MAGLLAWAAEVVGGGIQHEHDGEGDCVPLLLSTEQQTYALDLDQKVSILTRVIQDLRLRIPPPHISQRLPHLHAHSLASNADLALQLTSHSTTIQQTQLREIALQQENYAFKNEISNCENKIQDKLLEADLLKKKLEEADETEQQLRAELDQTRLDNLSAESNTDGDGITDTEALKSDILDKLENKKKALCSVEGIVQNLEKIWTELQEKALRLPSPAQREKILNKQLHSLIEQLAAKQAQAEGLVGEVHVKEIELERLNRVRIRLESNTTEINMAKNRFEKNGLMKGFASSEYIVDPHLKPPFYVSGRTENQKRLVILRSAFLLYVLTLNILVFIKISL